MSGTNNANLYSWLYQTYFGTDPGGRPMLEQQYGITSLDPHNHQANLAAIITAYKRFNQQWIPIDVDSNVFRLVDVYALQQTTQTTIAAAAAPATPNAPPAMRLNIQYTPPPPATTGGAFGPMGGAAPPAAPAGAEAPAAAPPPPTQPDQRVREALEAAKLNYLITRSNDFRVDFRLENNRRQSVYVASQTMIYGQFEVRVVWSNAHKLPGPVPAELANRLLNDNLRKKIGAWEIDIFQDGSHLIMFTAKIPAALDGNSLADVIDIVMATADKLEAELTGGDDRY